jgi:ubiquinone/menaquinone biosynthesis C-methylase UbiE
MFDSFFSFGYVRFADPLLRSMRRSLIAFSGIRPGQSVLDVCCGTGAQVYEFARRGIPATGIDIDPAMLKQALYYHLRFPALQPEFILADASRMPFADGSFDAASVSLALHEKNRALQDGIIDEMKRVVKKGGTLIFADFRAPLPFSPVGIGIKAIESSVGGDHHSNFKTYIGSGGLSQIIRHNALLPERSADSVAGSVILAMACNTVCH